MEDWLPVVSAVTALVAVIVGPVVALAVARRQINANVKSANRHAWVEDLRRDLAEFLEATTSVCLQSELKSLENEIGMETLRRFLRARAKVLLLLDHTNEDHAELLESIDHDLSDWKKDERRLALTDEILEQARRIFRSQWSKIREGK